MNLLTDYKENFEEALYAHEIKPYWDALNEFLDDCTLDEIKEMRQDKYDQLWERYEDTVNRKRRAKGFEKSILKVELGVLANALDRIK